MRGRGSEGEAAVTVPLPQTPYVNCEPVLGLEGHMVLMVGSGAGEDQVGQR